MQQARTKAISFPLRHIVNKSSVIVHVNYIFLNESTPFGSLTLLACHLSKSALNSRGVPLHDQDENINIVTLKNQLKKNKVFFLAGISRLDGVALLN
jgi:hypothetical protein